MIWTFSYKRKNYLIYSWFVYKIIIFFLYKVLGKGINYIQIVSGLEIEIDTNSKNIYMNNSAKYSQNNNYKYNQNIIYEKKKLKINTKDWGYETVMSP